MKKTSMISALLVPAIIQTIDLPPEVTECFETHIHPVLVDRCYGCHSKVRGKPEGLDETPRSVCWPVVAPAPSS